VKYLLIINVSLKLLTEDTHTVALPRLFHVLKTCSTVRCRSLTNSFGVNP